MFFFGAVGWFSKERRERSHLRHGGLLQTRLQSGRLAKPPRKRLGWMVGEGRCKSRLFGPLVLRKKVCDVDFDGFPMN